MTGRGGLRRVIAIVTLAGLAVAVAATPAPAPVPPKDCGFVEVKRKRFNIKSDQLRCAPARRYSRRYLSGSGRPRGYRCTDYGGGTAIEFRCSKGKRVFFAVRR